jgi:hypothetical protein
VKLVLVCVVAVVALCSTLSAQSAPQTAADHPRFVDEPCDPPLTPVNFGAPPDRADDPAVSRRIKELFDLDQARESTARQGKSWTLISAEDRERQKEILNYLQKGQINSAEDLYHAAMIFQHGNCAEHYKLANQLSEMAVSKGSSPAKWLYAATLDRYLMREGKPQKFGTQFVKVGPDGAVGGGPTSRWQLWEVDPATTDAERAKYDVPPLEEQRKKVERLNAPKQ